VIFPRREDGRPDRGQRGQRAPEHVAADSGFVPPAVNSA
jgi:hypothetical protein